MKMNRRTFLKASAASTISALALSVVPVSAEEEAAAEGKSLTVPETFDAMIAESAVEAEEIMEFDEEYDYDVVVVGAGTSGLPAAISAYQAGAKVAVLQKQVVPVAQGMLMARVIKEMSTEIGMKQYIHYNHKIYDYRNDPALWQRYVDNSQEAADWYLNELNAIGFADYIDDNDSKDHVYEDGNCYLKGTLFTGSMMAPTTALAEAYADRIDFYYETPAVQLIKEDGRVTGVIGRVEEEGKYLRFNASKGVILATGDYQNNRAMLARYNPDCLNFDPKQAWKTGDGHLMAMLAGAHMCPGVHSKMVHGASIMREEPLLAVNGDGVRFMEEDIEYCRRNTILRKMEVPFMWSLFDANYTEQVYGWGSDPTVPTVANATPEKLAAYVEKGQVLTADSIEELAALMEVDPENLKATVERYNELSELGMDLDFGKPSKYMQPLTTAPFYAVKRVYQISAIVDGLDSDVEGRVLGEDGMPIEGLYCAGNCSGNFYGDVDYSLDTMGLSVGRCITFGYLVGRDVAML